MSKKLFVGSLPFSTNNDELKTMFEPYGDVVSAVVINDKQTKKSKGYGFVEMGTEEMAQSAISNLNESEVKGRKIVVSEAKSESPRPSQSRERRYNRNNSDRRNY